MVQITGKLRHGVAVLALVAASGCVADFRNHGYIPPPDVVDEIIVGVDTRASVEDVAGSPTSAGILEESGYYYVRTRVKSFAYRAPEVVEREVLAISFDDGGVVSNVERFGLEQGRVIAIERRVTESSTVDRTFLRQLLGSLGRLGGFGR